MFLPLLLGTTEVGVGYGQSGEESLWLIEASRHEIWEQKDYMYSCFN